MFRGKVTQKCGYFPRFAIAFSYPGHRISILMVYLYIILLQENHLAINERSIIFATKNWRLNHRS